MGCDYYAELFVGFPVTEKDFWTLQGNPKLVCPKGCAEPGAGKFCQECGAQLELKQPRVPTPALQALADHLHGVGSSVEECYELLLDPMDTSDLQIIGGDPRRSSEDELNPNDLILCFRIDHIDESRTGGDHAWVMADLDEEFAKARVWAEIMGLGDQEVALYPGLYISC